MKSTFVITLEVDEVEWKDYCEKRKRRHLFNRPLNDHVEILVCDALKSALFPQVSCKPVETSRLRETTDAESTI